MNRLVFILLLSTSSFSFAQTGSPISVMDFVKIKNDKKKEAVYFYENNWKVYRDIALQKGYIKSYNFLTTKSDSVALFDMVLITEYTDSLQFKSAEARFQQIIKEVNPNGPKLLNNYKPSDFRQTLFSKQTETMFSSGKSN